MVLNNDCAASHIIYLNFSSGFEVGIKLGKVLSPMSIWLQKSKDQQLTFLEHLATS